MEPVVSTAGGRVEHGHTTVVVAFEPGPGPLHLVPPPWIAGGAVRERAGVGQRRHLDGLLVERGSDLARAAATDGSHRVVAVQDLDGEQEIEQLQAT